MSRMRRSKQPAARGRAARAALDRRLPWLVVLCLVTALGPGLDCPRLAESAQDPVRIAAIYAESGEASVGTAKQDFRGAALAVEAINASGGLLGRRVELVAFDNLSTPLGARHAALQAVEAGVSAVVGGPWSGMATAMAEVCQQARTPFVTSIATHPGVTRTGEWIFRVCYTDDQQGELLARFARFGLSAATAAVLVNVGSSYSQGLAETFSQAFTAAGGRIVCEQSFKSNDTDYSGELATVAAATPDVVFLPSYAMESGHIVRQAASMGITVPFLGGDGWGPTMIETGRGAVNGHFYTTHWHPDAPVAAGKDIAQAYLKAHGLALVQPDAILAYDAVMVLADAIRRAGSLDRNAIRGALEKTRDFPGGTGTITFDADRNPMGKEVSILRFENGRTIFFTSFR
ncbi:ABC transporter substrate-binding protein [Desulfolutivibrio sp.]|uniref:ABC transporter substrate-binding protein n=1 Tax=Desulfolutivibrio sp. TaxID=2773296 RepID=UPI002F96AC62